MPSNKKDIKYRIRSVQSTQKITKSMKLIATIKLKQLQSATSAIKPFAKSVRRLVDRVVASLDTEKLAELTPMLNDQAASLHKCIIIYSSDRGLCGAYHSSLFRSLKNIVSADGAENFKFILFGRKICSHFRRYYPDLNVIHQRTDIPAIPTAELIQDLFELLKVSFESHQISSASILYNKYISTISYKTELIEFLPLQLNPYEGNISVNDGGDREQVEFEPSAEGVLLKLLPLYIQHYLFETMLIAKTAELASRMNAMTAATDNAKKLIETLTISYNKARQSSITQELSEIVSGSESLK